LVLATILIGPVPSLQRARSLQALSVSVANKPISKTAAALKAAEGFELLMLPA
jgi:hypothetical protein